MNKKMGIIGIVALFAAVVAVMAILPGSGLLKGEVSNESNLPSSMRSVSEKIQSPNISVGSIEVLSLDETQAVLKVAYEIENPNDATLILQSIRYAIYEDDVKIGNAMLGKRFQQFIEGSNYYPILRGSTNTISSKAVIDNPANSEQIWLALNEKGPDNKYNWQIEGEAFFSTSSAVSGEEIVVPFTVSSSG